MRLAGKSAIVTGAASGFGAEIARVFAREGAKVAVLDINGSGAEAVAGEIGPSAFAIAVDVTKRADIDNAVGKRSKAFGRIDIVVNNAGWSHKNRPMLEVSEDEFDRVYAVNVKSIYHMAHAVVPSLAAQGGGVIINIGSTAGIRPRPGLTWYNGSKGAVNLHVALDGGGACPTEDPGQLCGAGHGRNRPSRAVHGLAGYAGEPREIHRHRAFGAAVGAARYSQRMSLPGLRRGGVRDRRGVGSGRRPDDLESPGAISSLISRFGCRQRMGSLQFY